ncbi:hypothetical protein GCM10022416_15950 [Actinomadura keratinilytica]|uniref:Uncharacterized protein n=1 Tax=Actinomadura keratinilytica TaxID=547461 RepID=A0ABP7YCY9_9ACTN
MPHAPDSGHCRSRPIDSRPGSDSPSKQRFCALGRVGGRTVPAWISMGPAAAHKRPDGRVAQSLTMDMENPAGP